MLCVHATGALECSAVATALATHQLLSPGSALQSSMARRDQKEASTDWLHAPALFPAKKRERP